jgi:rRNA processing protein Gar1
LNQKKYIVYDYSGNTNNVYGKVSKINEVDENIYVKIENPITKSRFSQYQNKDLCGTRFDGNKK